MTMSNPESSMPVLRQREAFAAITADLQALEGQPLPTINLDIRQSITTALGCMPELMPLKSRIVTELPLVDPELFEKMERYALALGHAHTVHLAATTPSQPIPEMTEELKGLYARLDADARALALRGIIDGERLAFLAGVNGPRNTAASTFLLVELFRKSWDKVVGKCATTLAELDEAERLAERLENAVGVKEQGPANVPEAAKNRHKAYFLFVRAYDDARRVVSLLRWRDGDADKIAPSLYAGRYKKSGTEVGGPEPEQGAAPSNTAPANGGTAVAAPPAATNPNAAPGMPDSPPFVRN